MNPFINAQKQLDNAREAGSFSEYDVSFLRAPQRAIHVSFPVRMDDGKVRYFQGYRVQFNDAKGPTKGGIRFHPDVSEAEVTALSFWMTIKNSVIGLPYGGGKGGVIVNPKDHSFTEMERITRGFIKAIHHAIGPQQDIPAPDVYTNPQTMAWMLDEYEAITGKHMPGLITGKPLSLGGSQGRGYSTAMGAAYVLRSATRKLAWNEHKTSIIIQGFGNAGMHMARILSEWGYTIKGISDSRTAIYEEQGIDVFKAISHKEQKRTLEGFGNEITNKELLEQKTDILVPAALENVITKENAANIKAKLIVELANGPVTPEADELLAQQNITVIPDVLANAGGVAVSYFEWVQNNYGYYWSEDEVLKKLEPLMVNAYDSIIDIAQKKQTTPRNAAFILALERIIQAQKLRGRL